MSTYKDINEIKRDFNNGGYFCHISIPKRVSENHVFDADLSVRKNREMVKEHNEKIQKLREEKSKQNSVLAKKLSEDIVKYLVGEYGFTKKQAEQIEKFAYNKYHSYMNDYFYAIDEMAEVVRYILDD